MDAQGTMRLMFDNRDDIFAVFLSMEAAQAAMAADGAGGGEGRVTD
jgi:hypothetical protein